MYPPSCLMVMLFFVLDNIWCFSSGFMTSGRRHSFRLACAAPSGLDTENTAKGVYVRISPITDLKISLDSEPPTVNEEEIAAHLKANPARSFDLVNVVDFVQNGGVQPENVVICDWYAVHVEGGSGWTPNSKMAGVAKVGHEFSVDITKVCAVLAG